MGLQHMGLQHMSLQHMSPDAHALQALAGYFAISNSTARPCKP